MHRDFKLANLFMHDDFLVIADFGFVKKGLEMGETYVGTPNNMAPEILEGSSYTYLVDLWAVGVSFFYLLFGKYPFDGVNRWSLLADIKKKSGSNLEINREINNISKICENFLKKILTYDTN